MPARHSRCHDDVRWDRRIGRFLHQSDSVMPARLEVAVEIVIAEFPIDVGIAWISMAFEVDLAVAIAVVIFDGLDLGHLLGVIRGI